MTRRSAAGGCGLDPGMVIDTQRGRWEMRRDDEPWPNEADEVRCHITSATRLMAQAVLDLFPPSSRGVMADALESAARQLRDGELPSLTRMHR